MSDKEKNEKEEVDYTKKDKQNIPPEVWAQLPDHIKKEIDPNYEPPAPEPIFEGASAGLQDSINRLRDGFEKIGLTLIGRMGEFATTLERVMMIVARIEKVENLVSEIKYFLKGLQKTLDGINMTLNKLDTLDLSIELENIKKVLQNQGGNFSNPATAPQTNSPSASTPTNNTVIETPTAKPTLTTTATSPQPTSNAAGDSVIEQIVQETGDSKEKVKKIFVYLNSLLTPESNYTLLSKYLDQTRDAISKCYKWVPTLYDIGKAVRKYKSKTGKLSPQDLSEMKKNIESWEQKILS